MRKDNYFDFIKAVIGAENNIEDEEILDKLMFHFMNSPYDLLNDEFDEVLEEMEIY